MIIVRSLLHLRDLSDGGLSLPQATNGRFVASLSVSRSSTSGRQLPHALSDAGHALIVQKGTFRDQKSLWLRRRIHF
jgi:hypothetical protein